jgi:hypothetical protein
MSCRAHVLWSIVMAAALAAPAHAQDVRLERPSLNVIEITDGAWRIRYGTTNRIQAPPQLLAVSRERAYFAHGPWLRLIDTTAGMVMGRWRFPAQIEAMTDRGDGTIDVRFPLAGWYATPNMTVRFDPAAPEVPPWDTGGLLSYRVAEWEALELMKTDAPDDWPKTVPNAASALPQFDELIARDPSAPMFRLMRARLLREAGDPRAEGAFAEVFDATSNDFTEWFRISRILEMLLQPERGLMTRAYERAFRDFIARGRDPRLVDTLIARLVLFLPGVGIPSSETARRSYLDQLYPLAPTSEATERGWAFHARALAQAGDETAAALWRERAEASRRESMFLGTLDVQLRHDRGLLLAIAASVAAIIFLVTRRVKYMPQMKMRRTAATRSGQRAAWVFGALGYWTRRERWSLLLLVAIGWLSMGYSRTYAVVMTRALSLQVHVGALSGPEDFSRYPPSDERTLLQAISLQPIDAAEAERLYRSIPQFAESWNNLGVLLARAGNDAESRNAFARASALDPTLGEAILNTTGQATTQATQTFQKYAPAGMKMTALPARERVIRAYVGPAWSQRHARILLGPFSMVGVPSDLNYLFNVLVMLPMIVGSALLVILIVALSLVALVPKRDATVPPSRATGIIELAIPGLAAPWRWAGALVLLTWCTGLLAAFFQAWFSSPYFLMAVSQAGILRAFGYDSAYFDLNPPMVLLLGVPIVLWVANALLIRAARTSS